MMGEDNTQDSYLIRRHLIETSKNFELSRLPPCHSALRPHIQPVRHRVSLLKQTNEQIIEAPKPQDGHQGWVKTDTGILEPLWSDGPVGQHHQLICWIKA